MIAFGASDMTKAYVGSTEVSKAYLGDELVWGGSSPVLPYDAEIEYLASTGTQWIDTGYVPNGTDIVIKGKFYLSNYSANYGRWFASYTDENSNAYRIIRNNNKNNSIFWTCGVKAGYSPNITIAGLNNLYTFEMSYGKLILNGTTYTTTLKQQGNNNVSTMRLFAPGSSGTTTSGRFYFFELLKNGVKILDLIPVRKDGIGYMYDKVSGQLLGNAGTGSFTIGPDVS